MSALTSRALPTFRLLTLVSLLYALDLGWIDGVRNTGQPGNIGQADLREGDVFAGRRPASLGPDRGGGPFFLDG